MGINASLHNEKQAGLKAERRRPVIQADLMKIKEQLEILTRGVSDLISTEELEEKLKKADKEGRPLKVKLGLDPTAPDIHLGHTVVLRKLRQFQDLGHEVYLIIGDFTGRIGDPSGKSETRKQLTEEEVKRNARTYQQQFAKVLDEDKTRLVFNGTWLGKLDFANVLELSSKYTVARMLEREDFSSRFHSEKPISIHEFFYPLMQGYDSVAIKADVELGGTDQRFNLLVGRELQREYGQKPQVVLMMPLLEGLDGTNKMSKSLGNYIGINDQPADMYGKIMSIPDKLIVKYFELLSDLPREELNEMGKRMETGEINPMEYKKRLAGLIVTEYHGEQEAKLAAEEFTKVFSRRKLPEDMPEITFGPDELEEGKLWIVKLISRTGLVDSNSEARRMLKQGAVSINGEKQKTINKDIELEDGMVIQVGKRRFARIKLD